LKLAAIVAVVNYIQQERAGMPFHHLKLAFLYAQKDFSNMTYRFAINRQCMGLLSLRYHGNTVV